MYEKMKAYKEKLEKCIQHYTCGNVSESSAKYADTYIKYWLTVSEAEQKMKCTAMKRLTPEEVEHWNAHMKNQDGTTGGRWTVSETNMLADALGVEFTHISAQEWNVTCNKQFSDYYKDAVEFGVDVPNYYAGLARSFLFDLDGPEPHVKLWEYYEHIVKPSMQK